jgi:hypothetical protein
MPSNFKKLVRARMEKTGESYQTAARHLRERGTNDEGPEPPSDVDPMDALRFIAKQPRWFVVEPGTLFKPGDPPLTEHERVDHYECHGCGKDLPIRAWTDDSPQARFLGPATFSGFVMVCPECYAQRRPLSREEAAALIRDVSRGGN